MIHSRRAGAGGVVAVLAVLAVLGLSACGPRSAPAPTLTPPADADVERGIEYRQVDGEPLALDACLPQDPAGPSPAAVLVHGGAFQEGNRSSMLDLCQRLAEAGIAAFSVDYRLVPAVYPAQVEDVVAAVGWVRDPAQVQTFGLGPDVSIVGSSAGAIIALSAAASLAAQGAPLTSAVALSVAGDLRPEAATLGTPAPDLAQVVLGYLGCDAIDDCDVAGPASPVTQAAQLPPTLLVHGSDEIIPLPQAESLAAALESAGVPHELLVNEGPRHGLQLLDAATSDAIVGFLLGQ